MTDASAEKMKHENKVGKTENKPHDEYQEVEQLNAEITQLKAANQRLREQHEEVQTENQHPCEQLCCAVS